MVIIVHSWNYLTRKREGVSHLMITDDLKKTNMHVNKFLEDVFAFYNNRIWEQIQRYLKMLAFFYDNCGYQFKSGCVAQNSFSTFYHNLCMSTPLCTFLVVHFST